MINYLFVLSSGGGTRDAESVAGLVPRRCAVYAAIDGRRVSCPRIGRSQKTIRFRKMPQMILSNLRAVATFAVAAPCLALIRR